MKVAALLHEEHLAQQEFDQALADRIGSVETTVADTVQPLQEGLDELRARSPARPARPRTALRPVGLVCGGWQEASP
eukprot:SAG22_NODE_3480_length_1687_cov_2.137280_3_plen_76_part_01